MIYNPGKRKYELSDVAVPTLANTNAFTNINSTCKIKVPAALVDEWKAATNWATYADAGYLIRQVETGAEYSEAIDVADAPYTYVETDKPDVSSVEQIHAERGMKYVYGQYYSDPEDGWAVFYKNGTIRNRKEVN